MEWVISTMWAAASANCATEVSSFLSAKMACELAGSWEKNNYFSKASSAWLPSNNSRIRRNNYDGLRSSNNSLCRSWWNLLCVDVVVRRNTSAFIGSYVISGGGVVIRSFVSPIKTGDSWLVDMSNRSTSLLILFPEKCDTDCLKRTFLPLLCLSYYSQNFPTELSIAFSLDIFCRQPEATV